ncbi:MAG: DivIVA domain-containing protein [Clostridiales bacterium]|nr:DivIVA domain-containing protein [Clostridiales bacterium]
MPDRFTYIKRGYDPEEVDRYIDTLEQVVKSYKDKDSAIKNAIISAQMAADNIIKNAHIQVAESRTQALSQIQNIIASIGEQRAKLKDFQEEYTSIMKKYLFDIDENDMNRIYDKITALEQLIARAAYIAPSNPNQSTYAPSSSAAGASPSYPSNPNNPSNGNFAASASSATSAPFAAISSGSVAYEPMYEMEED